MSDLLKAVSEGVLDVGGKSIRVIQLDNGQRVMDRDDVEKFFDDGGDAYQMATELALSKLRHDRDELLKEVELFAEIARIESPGTQLGGWDWKGMHERLTALISRIRDGD